jgi:hypothetical protein
VGCAKRIGRVAIELRYGGHRDSNGDQVRDELSQ